MSPIISAKCVKLNAQYSHHCLQVNTILLVLACCFISLSNIPIAVSFVLLGLLFSAYSRVGLLLDALQGPLAFYSDRRVDVDNTSRRLTLVLFPGVEWALLLRIDKQWTILWRDSVEAEPYRQLIVQLKREH